MNNFESDLHFFEQPFRLCHHGALAGVEHEDRSNKLEQLQKGDAPLAQRCALLQERCAAIKEHESKRTKHHVHQGRE